MSKVELVKSIAAAFKAQPVSQRIVSEILTSVTDFAKKSLVQEGMNIRYS